MTPSIPTAADIAAPYPLQELEANEGICAQESEG